MLTAPLLVQHSLTVHYDRHLLIRRDANRLEDALNEACPGGYGPPQLVPVPDEFEPEFPRIMFNANSGYSSITVSQVAIAFTVNYSEDWQRDPNKCVEYLKQRTSTLFKLLEKIKINITFVGIGTKIRLGSRANDGAEVMKALRTLVAPDFEVADPIEMSVRVSNGVDNKYFNNIVISSYASWTTEVAATGRFSQGSRTETGVELTGDYNSRFAFNEGNAIAASLEESLSMVDNASQYILQAAARFSTDHV